MDPPERKEAFVHYQNVSYIKVGTGPNNLLLCPGTLGTWDTDFKLLVETIDRNQFTLVVMDLPGYGYSRPPLRKYDGNQDKNSAIVANKLMQELKLTPYSIAGWSEGGRTALNAAHDFPDEVKKVAFWGTPITVDKQYVETFAASRSVTSWPKVNYDKFELIYGEQLMQKIWGDYIDWAVRCADKGTASLGEEILPEIYQPCLVLYGEDDWLGGGLPEARMNAAFLPNSKLKVCKKGKHDIHISNKEWFDSEFFSFFLAK